jgi:hypothetical protein
MQYLFAAIGGSGSTFLVRSLSTRLQVGNKPDTVYRARLPGLSLGLANRRQGSIEERAPGFGEIADEPIGEFLVRYVRFLRAAPDRTAVFNTVAELGLFSRHRVPGVVFLVRHPLHAFASWAKAARHGDVVEYLGGINSCRAIGHFAARSNAVFDEIQQLRLLGILGGVLRYEFIKADLESFPELAWVFDNFDSSKRNDGQLSLEAESLMRDLTADRVNLLYKSWRC